VFSVHWNLISLGKPKVAHLLGFGEFSLSVRASVRPSVILCILQISTFGWVQGKRTRETLKLGRLLGTRKLEEVPITWEESRLTPLQG
jgi:hypothetical protein